MYKSILFLFLMLLVFNLYAQEDLTILQQNNDKKINIDAAYIFGSEIKNGGTMAFGILLYNKGRWNIRSHTGIDSYTIIMPTEETYTLGITEKITFTGQNSIIGIGRPYGYIDGGVSFYGNKSKEKLFSTPLWYKAGFGCGADINIVKNMAWFTEFGVVYHIMENKYQWRQILTIGMRIY